MNNAHRPARAMRAQLIALLALFSFSFLSAEPFGQAPQCDYFNAISRYGHQVWTEDNGLPQNTVTSFLQTPDGYIWMGTQEGLVRFDGERFDVFDRNTNPELKMNFVTTLAYTPDGTLWIGTEGGGLSSYKAGAFKNYASVDGFSATAIPVVAPSADGSVWVGTGAKGVAHYQNGKFTYLTTSDGLPSNDIHALHEDRNGTLWIGTDKGAATYSNGKVSHPDLGKTFADKLTMTFYEPPTGSIWIGTSYGLVHVAGKTVTSFTTADGLTANYVTAVGEDSHGDMWIGTGGAGLNRMSCGMISTYQVSDGLSNDQIGAVMIDKEDNVWVGTNGGGLNRFHGTNFHAYGPAEGLGGNFAFSILEDHAGNLWIGTAGGGLNKFSNGKFTHYTTKEGLPTNFTMGLYEDAQSNIWVGTFGGGLSKLSNGKFTTYTAPSNLSGVSAMTGDGSGGMWIGTRDGLDHLVNGTFTNYGMKDGLTATRINCLLRDSKGNLWIGSHGGGVDMMKDGKFTNYSTKNILPCDEVYAMLEDRDGTIWIGTDAAGLCRLKYGKITTYTMKEGLFDDQIFSIVEDGSNNLWMSSNRGVFRVNVDDLNKFADGSLAKITSISYGKADGMRSRECDGGYQPAAWRAHDGSFWFPTVKGIVNVDPEHLKINTQPPSVSIEQFLADNKDVDQLKSMSFAPGTNRFEFRYAGMSFTAPEFVKFKYKLEGFDNDWINAGTHRAAYYTNLPPGTYTFRVQASNSDGVWNTTGAAATFTLAPFFYQTSWFFGVCIIGLIVLAYGVHRLRLRHVRTNELVELVDERTRDLRIERDKTEAALTQIRSAHGKIREQAALLDRAQDAIFVLDFNYAIEFWNMGAERIYGWTPSQASGKNAIELLSTDKMPSLSEAYTAVHENGEWHGEVQHVTRSGKEIVVLSNWSLVLDDAGKPKSILVINTDITEKKKIEVQFLRSQRMQSVGTLAGGIAHDLNNVLSPIMLSIDVLKLHNVDESCQRALQIMEESAKRGAGIIKQVLAFSRGAEGERSAVQVKYIVSELEKIAKDTFPREIEVRTTLDKDLWNVQGDPTQLYQVLMNLCVNARDAMPEGGKLIVSASNTIIDEHYAQTHADAKPGNYLALSVQDNGMGMTREVLDKIFEPFFTTKEIGKGTGLGLSTALGIIRSHGGFINVYSEPKKGTKFDVYLPAIASNGKGNAKVKRRNLPKGNGEIVLVVDDEHAVREAQKSMLEMYGYKVMTAVNGVEAAEIANKHQGKIKIVITDMMMPVMDGVATIRKLREIDSSLRFLAVSGLMGDQKVSEISSLGNIRFLQKPFGTDKLIFTVHEILEEPVV